MLIRKWVPIFDYKCTLTNHQWKHFSYSLFARKIIKFDNSKIWRHNSFPFQGIKMDKSISTKEFYHLKSLNWSLLWLRIGKFIKKVITTVCVQSRKKSDFYQFILCILTCKIRNWIPLLSIGTGKPSFTCPESGMWNRVFLYYIFYISEVLFCPSSHPALIHLKISISPAYHHCRN